MFISLSGVVAWIMQYRYFVLFPATVLEGPIITVVAGFLASLGQMNIGVAYAVVVAGDIVGDIIYYSIGRFGRKTFIAKYGRFIGVTENKLASLDAHFDKHTGKTLLIGKFTQALGLVILVAAGAANVRFGKFVFYNVIGTLPKSLALIVIGYLFGSAYEKINTYIDYTSYVILAAACVLIVVYLVIRKMSKKYL